MADRPNILIYMNDQEQAHVTLPGHPCRTPNADRLAAEGLRFNRCYTPCAHCCPSRATFQTGLYPSGHGVYNNILNDMAIHRDVYPETPFWSEHLRDAGYALTWSGKWHVTCDRRPADVGWDERFACAVANGERHGHNWEHWQERARTHQEIAPADRARGQMLRPGWGPYQHFGTMPRCEGQDHDYTPGDRRIVTLGVEGLRDAAASGQPWCAFIGPNGPHDPYIIPEKYATMYDPADVEMPASWGDDLADKPVVYQRQRRFWSQLGEDEQRAAVAHYWGYCTMQDDLLGEVLAALDDTGQADDTLVLFMSDHGDYNGAHGLWMKGVPAFDEGYRVPCIARWPNGLAQPGREIDAFVNLADFAPTFVELSGAAPLPKTHGRSLVPFLKGQPLADWRDQHYTQLNGVELYYTQRSITTRDWKYVFNGFDWDELYDLRRDPHETRNLIAGGQIGEHAEVVQAMCERMWREGQRTGDIMHNPYGTVSLAPWGPMAGLQE